MISRKPGLSIAVAFCFSNNILFTSYWKVDIDKDYDYYYKTDKIMHNIPVLGALAPPPSPSAVSIRLSHSNRPSSEMLLCSENGLVSGSRTDFSSSSSSPWDEGSRCTIRSPPVSSGSNHNNKCNCKLIIKQSMLHIATSEWFKWRPLSSLPHD